MQKGGGSTDHDAELSQHFVQEHLFYAVEGILQTKRRLNTTRSWTLPVCVDDQTIRLSIDCLADGAWGTLSGSACIVYLIQRYKWRGSNRTSIFLYGSATGMNSLTKLTHQVDAELAEIHLAVKETNKCLTSLADLNIKPGEGGPRLISDSQTCLSLCSRPSSTLDLSTSLVVSRVQENFWYKNLFYLPGSYFSTNIDQE